MHADDEETLEQMVQALRHRGPESRGFLRRGSFELGMRRLKIIDLAHGDQPIFNETGDLGVVFNGEIYNYRELRDRLRAKGHEFTTDSDTEVIVHLYEEYAERCVEHLRGMFAFAVLDGDTLFLARDPLGIKPLYFAHCEATNRFAFASEIKALLQSRTVDPEIDPKGFADYLVLGEPAGGRTFFAGIECLPPGHWARVRSRADVLEVDHHCYYHPTFEPVTDLSFDEACEELLRLLRDAVQSHLVADVEVGLTISGGIDSTLLALLMAECHTETIQAFTIASQSEHPDLRVARQICSGIDCQHHVHVPSFEEYMALIPDLVAAVERPTRAFGHPFFLLCHRIAEQVKVCLCGEGADELFGGYPEFVEPHRRFRGIVRGFERLRKLGLEPTEEALELSDLRDPRNRSSSEWLQKLFEYHLGHALPRRHLESADHYSMSASLEMRVPFLDHDVVEFVNRLPIPYKVNLPFGIRKHVLKRAALDRYGSVVADAALREKMGFPQSVGTHLQRFEQLCDQWLPADYLESHDMGFRFRGKRDLLLYDLFLEIFFERRGVVGDDFDLIHFMRSR